MIKFNHTGDIMTCDIYGKNPILAAMDANRKIYEIVVTDQKDHLILSRAKALSIPIKHVNKSQMNARFIGNHQGFGAKVEGYTTLKLTDALSKPGLKRYVMLDSIEDPHNFGAILRSADAFNISGVIFPKHRNASITGTVVKVSTGAIETVDLIQVTNLNQAIETLKQHNIWVVGLDMDAEKNLDEVHLDTDLCFVFGSEGKGLHQLVKKNCDYLIKVPMKGHVNSLNVSVTAGIVLYTITTKRG